MRIKGKQLFAAVLVLAGLTAAIVLERRGGEPGGGPPRGPGDVLVVAKPVQMVEFIDQIEAIGTAQANESVDLTSKLTETVSRVRFEDGQFAAAGDVLVELTSAEETAQLAEAQANVDETRQQHERLVNLVGQNLAPQTQLDEATARFQTAKARLDAILARLDDRLIRAPFAGVLGFRNVSTGTLLTPNHVITTIDDIERIKLDFTIPELYLASVRPGLEVTARSRAYPERRYPGQVASVNSRVDPITRSVQVRAIIENGARELRPGMLLTVDLIRSRQELKAVPEDALVPVGEEQFVYRVSQELTAERVPVTIGRQRPGFVEITSDLPLGTLVVTEGVVRLRPGVKVKLKEEAQPAGAGLTAARR